MSIRPALICDGCGEVLAYADTEPELLALVDGDHVTDGPLDGTHSCAHCADTEPGPPPRELTTVDPSPTYL